MPFCARDVGIFSGILLGALVTLIMIIQIKWHWLVIGFLPMAIDGILQEIMTYESNNTLRFMTGALAGAAGAIFLCNFIAAPVKEEKNDDEKKPII